MKEFSQKKALLEAALFVSEKPVSIESLARILECSMEEVRNLISMLRKDMEKSERGIELIETPLGYELRVKSKYRENIATLAPFADLSEGMLRTLGIVTLKYPIKQSEIVRYQGNKAYSYIKELENKGLIITKKFRRTKLINLSPDFEKYFGKSVEEVRKILKEKVEK